MIGPLPHLPVTPMPAAAGATQPEPPVSEPFEQLLAATPGLPAPAEAATPGLARPLPPARAPRAMTDIEATNPSHPTQRPTAMMFNEAGLFGRAAAVAGADAASPYAPAPPYPAVDLPAVRAEEPLRRTGDIQSGAGPSLSFGDGMIGSGASPARLLARPVNGSCPPPRVAAASSRPWLPGIGPRPRVEPAPAESSRTPRAHDPRPAARALSALRVVLRELEQGLHVTARVDRLDPAERERLRDAITALLARHGLSPRSVRIEGPETGPASQRRN